MPDEFWGRVLRRKADLVLREVAGESLLIPIRGSLADLQRIYTLNRVARAVWAELDGGRTMAEVRERLLERFEVGREQLEGDLREFAAQAVADGLAEEVPA